MKSDILRSILIVMAVSMCLKDAQAATDFAVHLNPFEQWLLWEETANLADFRKTTASVPISFSILNSTEAQSEFLPAGKALVQSLAGGQVPWFHHPFNTSSMVPFQNKEIEGVIQGRLTSSASIVVAIGNRYFSLKIPTDRPFRPKDNTPDEIKGPTSTYQPTKADRRLDTTVGADRGKYIANIDRLLGADPSLIILNEVGRVQDTQHGNGILVRDVNILNDGHYYLPAHSLPYVGDDIARANHMTWEQFMEQHYAKPLGKMYARLFLRYGLVPEAHNPQNVLIQMDRNLRPTGKLVLRDVSDTSFVKDIIQDTPGFEHLLENEVKMGQKLSESFIPNTRFLFWMMGDKLLARATELAMEKAAGQEEASRIDIELEGQVILRKAAAAFKASYHQEIEAATGVDILSKVPASYADPIKSLMGQDLDVKVRLTKYFGKGPSTYESILRKQSGPSEIMECRHLF